jgi:zinc protease
VRSAWVLFAALVGCAAVPHRDGPPTPPRETHLGLDITQMHLTNGLRVVLVRDPLAAEVSVTMRYRVGAADDPPGEEGMAHLVEHLMFQQLVGTQTIWSRLEAVTRYKNAETKFDATIFEAHATAAHLDDLLEVEAIRARQSCNTISEATFEREREVVINEVRLKDYAVQLWDALDAALYPVGHPYARTHGDEATLRAITREEACAFVDAHYAPNNAAMVVSGNITLEQLEKSLTKYLLPVPKRDIRQRVQIPPMPPIARQLSATAPIDDDALILAWPLPMDPRARSEVEALAPMAFAFADGEIRGRVVRTEFGDDRAKMIGIVVLPHKSETLEAARRGVVKGIEEAPSVFSESWSPRLDRATFEETRQGAIANLFGSFEAGSGRDERIAAYVLDGRDPGDSLGAEVQGLRELTRESAAEILREHLNMSKATVVTLQHAAGKKRGRDVDLTTPIHDLGQQRDPPDPAAAHRPAVEGAKPPGIEAMRVRTLANGMQVVLLPLTSVPKIEIRLVFDVGSAADPADKRGAALVAGHMLGWSTYDHDEVMQFYAAGGHLSVDVAADHTTFSARGLDMHLDLLLTGVQRLIRDGTYAKAAATAVEIMHRVAKQRPNALAEAWLVSQLGEDPYAGFATSTLTYVDAAEFAKQYYKPGNATLVIAGKFDTALADRWIDYLFADWEGKAPPRASSLPRPRPASLARASDASTVAMVFALPARSGSAASRQIAAAMLDDIVHDVRHQLGASYLFTARLAEARLAATYDVEGIVDATRAAEAVELVRSRIEQLRAGGDDAARAFVSARARAAIQLRSVAGSAASLARRVEHDFELGRAPLSDVATASEVEHATIENIGSVLADLDLTQASVMMAGPTTDVEHAFAVLGRKPTFVDPDPDRDDPIDTHVPDVGRVEAISLRPARPLSTWTLAVMPGYTFGSVSDHGATGYTLTFEIGVGADKSQSVGVHATIGSISGSYMSSMIGDVHPFTLVPIQIDAYARGTAYNVLWGSVFAGLHIGLYSDSGPSGTSETDVGLDVGAEVGVDVLRYQRHHLGVFARAETVLGGSTDVTSVGLRYRY